MSTVAVTAKPLDSLKVRALARIVHEANRAFCESIGDTSLVPWDETDKEIQDSAIDGVQRVLDDPKITPKDLHDEWVIGKVEDGWVYGEEKDEEAKTHPCLVDYKLLPVAQRYKDSLFLNIILSYIEFKKQENRKKDEED